MAEVEPRVDDGAVAAEEDAGVKPAPHGLGGGGAGIGCEAEVGG